MDLTKDQLAHGVRIKGPWEGISEAEQVARMMVTSHKDGGVMPVPDRQTARQAPRWDQPFIVREKP